MYIVQKDYIKRVIVTIVYRYTHATFLMFHTSSLTPSTVEWTCRHGLPGPSYLRSQCSYIASRHYSVASSVRVRISSKYCWHNDEQVSEFNHVLKVQTHCGSACLSMLAGGGCVWVKARVWPSINAPPKGSHVIIMRWLRTRSRRTGSHVPAPTSIPLDART